MLKKGDIAFLKGAVPVQIKDVLELPSTIQYELQLMQPFAKEGDFDLPKKVAIANTEASMVSTNGKRKINDEVSATTTAAQSNSKKRLKFDDDIYSTTPKQTGPRQTKTSAKAASTSSGVMSSNGTDPGTKTTNSTDRKGPNKRSTPNATPPEPAPEIVTTQCSEENDYFTQNSDTKPTESMKRQLHYHADGQHSLIKARLLDYYTQGAGMKNKVKYPKNRCRVCKEGKTVWGCVECSNKELCFTIHHPTENPDCLKNHMAMLSN